MLSSAEPRMASPAELEKLRTAFRDNPRSTVFVALAQALVAAGRPDEAVEVSRQGLTTHPDHIEGRLGLARAHIALSRWKEAEGELVKVVKLDRYHQKAFGLLGEVLIHRANWDVAVKALSRAHDLDPLDERVSGLLAKARARAPVVPATPTRPEGALPEPTRTPRPPATKPRSDFQEELPTVVNTRGIPAEAMPTPAPTILTIKPQKGRRDDDTDVEPSEPVMAPPEVHRPAPVVPMSAPRRATSKPLPAVPPPQRRRPPTAPKPRRGRPLTAPPEYRPQPAPPIAGHASPDDWLNQLLGSGTPFDDGSSIVIHEPGPRWGHHLKHPFLWLWLGL